MILDRARGNRSGTGRKPVPYKVHRLKVSQKTHSALKKYSIDLQAIAPDGCPVPRMIDALHSMLSQIDSQIDFDFDSLKSIAIPPPGEPYGWVQLRESDFHSIETIKERLSESSLANTVSRLVFSFLRSNP